MPINHEGWKLPLAVKSHPAPEYAWEGVELALSSTNAVEHLSLPDDAASRVRTSSIEMRWP